MAKAGEVAAYTLLHPQQALLFEQGFSFLLISDMTQQSSLAIYSRLPFLIYRQVLVHEKQLLYFHGVKGFCECIKEFKMTVNSKFILHVQFVCLFEANSIILIPLNTLSNCQLISVLIKSSIIQPLQGLVYMEGALLTTGKILVSTLCTVCCLNKTYF